MSADMKRVTIEIVTDASGDYTTETIPLTGGVYQYRYIPDASTPLDTGADLTIAGRDTGIEIATLTDIGTSAFTKAPRQLSHGVTGTAGSNSDAIIAVDEPLDITVAQGGNVRSGVLHIWIAR